VTLENIFWYDQDSCSFKSGSISWENGIITELCEFSCKFANDLIIPGLVDIHTHGRCGYDFNTASVDELRKMKLFYAEKGVTTVVPTLASDTFENLLGAISRIREAGYVAVHLEGRYLNPAKRGAHAEKLLSALNTKELDALFSAAGDMHLHVSAAYELDESGEFLAALLVRGATTSLAHTNATYSEAISAVNRGLSSFTHLFNTMPPIHHREGGAVLAALLSDAYVEIICDGFHLAPETVNLVQRTKDPSKVILITDSMEGTGAPDGNYSIAGSPVILKDGKAYTEDGAIAGSTLELLCGVKNYSSFCSVSFEQAVCAATRNPAKMLGLENVGSLSIGAPANFLQLSADYSLKSVYLGGEKLI